MSVDPPTESPNSAAPSGTFHELNRVLSEDQQVLTIPTGTPARDALALMQQHGFSQLPVTTRRRVVGLFSYRSFALAASSLTLKGLPADLAVEDAMEAARYYRITEDIASVVPTLDAQDAIVVGTPERLDGIITAADVMRYLQTVAQPYLTIAEIEHTVRDLIRRSVTLEELEALSREALKTAYKHAPDHLPIRLDAMTFGDYVQLVGHGSGWKPYFARQFGGERNRVRAKLEELRELRNILFHLKRELEDREHAILASHQEWLRLRLHIAEDADEAHV